MQKKRVIWKILSLFLTIWCLCTSIVCAEEKQEPKESELYAKACALVDGNSERLLYGKEEKTMLPNASTTKILTCILALETCKPDEIVTFSKKAASQPKVHLGAGEGEQFYLKDLLYGLMLESYNDCACAIAEHVAGSVEEFAKLMNEKAEELGCTDSHFVTPNGLDAEDEEGVHHTTAYDLCRIMSYCAWKSPKCGEFLEITQTRTYHFTNMQGTAYAVSNKNAFLDMMDHVITGKTGYTSKAGYCYVAALEEGGRHYAIALLASGWPNHKTYRWSDAKTLFTYGMENYQLYRVEKEPQLPDLKMAQGYQEGSLEEWASSASLPVYVDADVSKLTFLKSDTDKAEVRREQNYSLSLPVKKGQKVGNISYCLNGKEVYSCSIRAKSSVGEWNFEKFFHVLWKEVLLDE